MITHVFLFYGSLVAAAALVPPLPRAAPPAPAPAVAASVPEVVVPVPAATAAARHPDGAPPRMTLAQYRAMAASQFRNYDRTQDISPRQLLMLLEVSERADASLGQALATGELESARTWNDYVRPTLKNGSLGSATGVWQFLPGTFHNIIKKFGKQLLAATAADAGSGRERLDLGAGPFTDAKVRRLIQETANGQRGAEDEELQLLRHNFTVLAFAKHYLSLDSGATTPEEDYLFHFLGAGQGRRVLALARGEARYTLCVKPAEPPPVETTPGQPGGDEDSITIAAIVRAEAAVKALPAVVRSPAVVPAFAPEAPPPLAAAMVVVPAKARPIPLPRRAPATASADGRDARLAAVTKTEAMAWGLRPEQSERDRFIARMQAEVAMRAPSPGFIGPAVASPVVPPPSPPPVPSEWGLPANSATVTGNLGMFYRDGKGQRQPYTWAGFLENLARRVRAKDQPAFVRGKYGVGFTLKGGDLPERAFNAQAASELAEFRHGQGRPVLVPEGLVLGSLTRGETVLYKERLAALISQGDDQPLDTLPPEAMAALHHLRLLPPNVQEANTTNPQLQKALHGFRKKVGKDEPDDPAHANHLLPAERVALEIYGQRITRYALLQTGQRAAFGEAPELNRIAKMSPRFQRLAAPHIAAVQGALAAHGLLTAPTHKTVWRDKKKKKHVEYQTLPFPGKPDKPTVAALNTFQVRHGLLKTDGILDPVTLHLLSLPPLGPEIFAPPSGPQCAFEWWGGTAPLCEVAAAPARSPRLPPGMDKTKADVVDARR